MRSILFFIAFIATGLVQAQTYFLNGDAFSAGDDCYTLTSEVNTQNGTVWYGEQINLLQPFSIQFNMNFGSIDANGADGICFVLQTVGTDAIGQSGGGMGYLNFGTSLGIEFDTWQNGEYTDPFFDHIAIEKNGDINHGSTNNIAGPVQADAFDENIEDGDDHVVRIEWDPVLQEIKVYFDCVFRLQGDVNLIDEIFDGQNLVYWGFTAATGGAFNFQTVCLQANIVNIGTEVVICQGMQPTLSVGSSLDGLYTWSPTDFLDDPTSPTPITTTTQDITYTVNFVDLCGDSVVQDIFVNVEELVLTALPNDVINCVNDQVTVELTANMPMAIDYLIFNDQNTVVANGSNLMDWIATASGNYLFEGNVDSLCFASTNFSVQENFDQVQLDTEENVILNCSQPSTEAEVTFDPIGTSFNWLYNGGALTNDNIPNLVLDDAGLYVVEATHPISGCTSLDSIQVSQDFITPMITIGEQDTLSCLSPLIAIQGIVVLAAHDYSLAWTAELGSEILSANSLAPMVNSSDVYTMQVTDLVNGCQSSASVFVAAEELQAIDPSFLVFPNAVSPNQDQFNPDWRVFLKYNSEVPQHELFKDWDLKIFDRWGKKIAQIESASQTWNASEVAEGVYFYTLVATLLCGEDEKVNREGYIHVMR